MNFLFLSAFFPRQLAVDRFASMLDYRCSRRAVGLCGVSSFWVSLCLNPSLKIEIASLLVVGEEN